MILRHFDELWGKGWYVPILQVCRHHAAAVASDSGTVQQFECPYHGWTYGLDGRLRKANRLKGIKNFKAADFGLLPIPIDTWGPFIFLRFASDSKQPGSPSEGVINWLGNGGKTLLQSAGLEDDLSHVAKQDYLIKCNWKVFADNYLVRPLAYRVQSMQKQRADVCSCCL